MEQDIVFTVVLSALLILLLIAALVIVFFVWSRQRAKEQMKMAEARLLFEKEIRQVESEVSEQIMGQFARELHDNIGQQLTAMHYQIENQKMDNPQLAQGFQPIEIYLAEVTQQLRILSHTLNNDFIGHIGLWAAIQTEADRLRGLKRFAVHLPEIKGRTFLTKEEELMVFRIFQEITQNTLKHAQAKNLYIYANATETEFLLKVEDDGKGFDAHEILDTGRANGLRNILKRAYMAGMLCDIDALPGKGCAITLRKTTTPQ